MSIAQTVDVIDVDTHVVEPYDLWTSRISTAKYGDAVPHVRWDASLQEDAWFTGDVRLQAAASSAMAGYSEYWPGHPRTMNDAQLNTYDARTRLDTMTASGIHAQILYPNVAGFGTGRFSTMDDPSLMLECVKAYNDYLTEWSSADASRLIPMMALPFWDIELSLREMRRCADMGHRGIIFSGQPEIFGQPTLPDSQWNPVWAQAQEMQLPINFHIGAGEMVGRVLHEDCGRRANAARVGTLLFVGNARPIVDVITGGICHRYPDLKFVTVESGVGWIPFLLDALDWQWGSCGVYEEHPEYDLKPSEFFKRQIYGCFWFEDGKAISKAIEQIGVDRLLYETDFPHPTSMFPGPATCAIEPKDFIETRLAPELSPSDLQKVLHDNAAELYGLK